MDAAVKDFIEHCKKIIEAKTENTFATKKEIKKNVALRNLENYEYDYSINDDEGNKEDILDAYKRYKVAILKGWKHDDWLRRGDASIYSGSIEPDKKRRIMLSMIYTMATQLREKSLEELKGLPEEAFDGKLELTFPQYFLLYLYRVFMLTLDGGEDVTKLNNIVSELERELKLRTEIVSTEAPLTDGILGFAKDMAAKMGVTLPENLNFKPESGKNLMEVMSSMFQRPETQEFIQDIGNTFKESKDFTEALPKIFGKIKDPKTIDKVKNMASEMGIQMDDTPKTEENEKEET